MAVNGSGALPLETSEAWILFASFSGLGTVQAAPFCEKLCRQQWASCIQYCSSVPVLEKVLAAAFQLNSDTRELHRCQHQLLAKRCAASLRNVGIHCVLMPLPSVVWTHT